MKKKKLTIIIALFFLTAGFGNNLTALSLNNKVSENVDTHSQKFILDFEDILRLTSARLNIYFFNATPAIGFEITYVDNKTLTDMQFGEIIIKELRFIVNTFNSSNNQLGSYSEVLQPEFKIDQLNRIKNYSLQQVLKEPEEVGYYKIDLKIELAIGLYVDIILPRFYTHYIASNEIKNVILQYQKVETANFFQWPIFFIAIVVLILFRKK